MREITYNRSKAVDYALRWALSRNPRWADFENMGGDCTNFISQCVYAGAGVMNYTPNTGWYFNSLYSRAAAWTSASYFNKFMLNNRSVGPYGVEVSISQIQLGDVIQLQDHTGFIFHSLFVTEINGPPSIASINVSTHTYDARNRPLETYNYFRMRTIHIVGVRSW